MLLGSAFLLSGILWLVLQLSALVLLRGGWRIAAGLSLAAMMVAVVVGVLGGLAGANMAQIWIVIALPLCTLWIAALWLARGVTALLGR